MQEEQAALLGRHASAQKETEQTFFSAKMAQSLREKEAKLYKKDSSHLSTKVIGNRAPCGVQCLRESHVLGSFLAHIALYRGLAGSESSFRPLGALHSIG